MQSIRLIVFAAAVLFCVVSCSADNKTEDTSSESLLTMNSTVTEKDSAVSGEIDWGDPSFAYTFHPLSQPEDGWEYNSLHIDAYNGMLCMDMYKQDRRNFIIERCIAVLDPDIGIVKTIPYTKPEVDYYEDETLLEGIRGMQMIDENTFLHSSYTNILRYTPEREAELESGYLMLCNAAGTVLADSIIPGVGMNCSIAFLPDGRIAVLGGTGVCIYDAELNLCGQVGGHPITALMTSPLGELLAQGFHHGNYLRIDMEALTSTAETHYQSPKNITGVSDMFFSVKESAYEVYFANDIGFWGCDAGDAEALLLCDWRSCGLNYSNLTILGILDADRILVSVKDALADTKILGWLCRNPETIS